MAFRVVTVAAALAAVSINASPVRRQASGSSSGAAATGSAAGSSATPVSRVTPTPTVVSLWQQSREEAFRVGTAYLPVPSGSIAPGAAATTVVYYYTGQVTVTDLEISTRVATVPVTVGEVDIYSGSHLIEGLYAGSSNNYIKDCVISGNEAVCKVGQISGIAGPTSYFFTDTREGSVAPLSANIVAVPAPITDYAGVTSLAAAEGITLNGGDSALLSFYANSISSEAASISTAAPVTASGSSAAVTSSA